MPVFDHWAYIFALILYAPVRVEAAVVAPPPEVLAQHAEHARTVLSQPLPKLDGSQLAVHLVEVHYGPGESSEPHRHSCPVIGYVLEGAVRMQVKGGEEKTYRVGESFYEAPNGVHLVSANASRSLPARFLATFVCDHEAPLSAPFENSLGGR
jgi:quercetin dioxygenase-like cupin family protein